MCVCVCVCVCFYNLSRQTLFYFTNILFVKSRVHHILEPNLLLHDIRDHLISLHAIYLYWMIQYTHRLLPVKCSGLVKLFNIF